MFGDIRLAWRKCWEHFWCDHDYEAERASIPNVYPSSWFKCSKCGKVNEWL